MVAVAMSMSISVGIGVVAIRTRWTVDAEGWPSVPVHIWTISYLAIRHVCSRLKLVEKKAMMSRELTLWM